LNILISFKPSKAAWILDLLENSKKKSRPITSIEYKKAKISSSKKSSIFSSKIVYIIES